MSSQFYTQVKNLVIYNCSPLKKISDTEITLTITYKESSFEITIKCLEFGLFEILFDFPDKSIKYKNKADIGKNLKSKKFKNIYINEDSLILTNEENSNTYKIEINTTDFALYYYLNDNLLLSLNEKHKLNILNDINKNLKSNLIDITYYNIQKIFGLPERSQHLFIDNNEVIRLFNNDNFNQVVGEYDPTYGSIPMLHGVNKNLILTIFNNNCSDQYIDIKSDFTKKNKEIVWLMEGGIIDLYLSSDFDFCKNLQKTAKIVGHSYMPPLWVFGYHQCRWGYKDCNDVIDVEKKFEELNIPIDCFWFDIDHTDQNKYFTWNPETFKNIKTFLDTLKNKNKYFVTIIDPHIKVDENYFVCKKFLENDCYVKQKNEKGEIVNYIGKCWPGNSYYVDFINYEKVLPIYKELYKTSENYFMNYDNFGTWVDMNEPSVFDASDSEFSMPKNNIHNDGEKIIEHKEIHNIYGYFYQKIMSESLKNYLNGKRHFTLSRSFYAGTQQNGFVWTGDQKCSFEFLNTSIETNMLNSLCGLSGTGSDVGGFDGIPSAEMMAAWYSVGIFYPFFRGHSCITSIRREPWVWEESVKNSIINSIKNRYHLLMYFYMKFYQHTKNGIPLLKPLWMKLRENFDELINIKHQGSLFLFGDELIGYNNYIINDDEVEILNKSINKPIYDLFSGFKLNNNFKKDESKMIQAFALGGSIIPWTEKVEKCSYYVRSYPITLKIFVDENKNAKGNYYLDDGISVDINGEYVYMEFELKNKKLSFANLHASCWVHTWGIADIIPLVEKIEIFGFGEIKGANIREKTLKVKYEKENDLNVIDLTEEKIKINEYMVIEIEN